MGRPTQRPRRRSTHVPKKSPITPNSPAASPPSSPPPRTPYSRYLPSAQWASRSRPRPAHSASHAPLTAPLHPAPRRRHHRTRPARMVVRRRGLAQECLRRLQRELLPRVTRAGLRVAVMSVPCNIWNWGGSSRREGKVTLPSRVWFDVNVSLCSSRQIRRFCRRSSVSIWRLHLRPALLFISCMLTNRLQGPASSTSCEGLLPGSGTRP